MAHSRKSEFCLQSLSKQIAHRILAMYDKYLLRLFLKCLNPAQQPFPIRVTADAGQPAYLSLYLDFLTEQLHMLCTLQKCPPQCPVCLIAHKEDGAFLPPEVVLQMMLDPAASHIPLADRITFGCGFH